MSDEQRRIHICRGYSSLPLVKNGSILVIVTVPVQSIKSGDLIIFNNRVKRLICHRVILTSGSAGERNFLTKGDGNLAADGWISGTQIIGRVESVDNWSTSSASFRFASAVMLTISRTGYLFYLFFHLPPWLRLRKWKRRLLPRTFFNIRHLAFRLLIPWGRFDREKLDE